MAHETPRHPARPIALGGCVTSVAKTAYDVVTLPVKAVSAGVDAVTTSQSEADARRGRELRRADEERGRAERQRCDQGQPLPTDNCTIRR